MVDKRPPWYKPFDRAKFDGAMLKYNDFRAKMLTEKELEDYDVELPVSWKEKPMSWITGKKQGLPAGSGQGIVQSPYADVYTKVYGVVPSADLPKYRTMYRNYADVQQAVEMQSNLAVGRGFVVKHKSKRVANWIMDVLDDIDIQQHMLTMASDTLCYGNSFTEVLWDDSEEVKEPMYEHNGSMYTASEAKSYGISGLKPAYYTADDGTQRQLTASKFVRKPKSSLVGLKDLDPVYMRVRRDSWGNVFGYLQWMSYPPVLIDANNCIHIKNRPKSTGYESAYGVSILMPLIKNTDLLDYFENDAAVWMHYKAVPPLTVKGGTPEKPYGTEQMKELMRVLKGRSAQSTIFVKGDVIVEEMKTVASDLNVEWWINYLLLKRTQALGVPGFLMGQKETAGRSSAQVHILEFITRLQILQEFIAKPIERYIIRPLIDEKFGRSVPTPKIVWKPIIEETPDMRPQRLIQLLQAGALTVNEVRIEMGFKELEGEKYDKPVPMMEPAMNPSGFPPKAGAVPGERQKLNPPVTNKPSSTLKGEGTDERKKLLYLLMKQDDEFRESMTNIVAKAKAQLRNGDALVKEIKDSFINETVNCINNQSAPTYILSKHDRDQYIDLTIEENEAYAVEAFKGELYNNFVTIFDNMVKMKEEGKL